MFSALFYVLIVVYRLGFIGSVLFCIHVLSVCVLVCTNFMIIIRLN